MTIFEDALQLIDELSVEDLRSLTKEQLMDIVSHLTPEQASDFIFAKNIKIFGGINGYVNDFFAKNTISKIKAMPNGVKVRTIASTIELLNKMLKPELTEENRSRINNGIAELREPSTAPAAGGYRKAKKSKNNKSKKKSRKNRKL
jgi:hypothetical protein